MDEFPPEDLMEPIPGGEIDTLSDAFLAAGADAGALDEEFDDDPIEPMDI
jgi:hypothetical protein